MTGGFIITESCLQSAKSLFEQFREAGGGEPRALAREKAQVLLESNWGDIDKLYLAMYSANLFGLPKVGRSSRPLRRQYRQAAILGMLVDVEFPKVNSKTTFEDSLLNELDVADLQKLRSAVSALIPYKTRISHMSFGCLYMEVAVLVNKGRKLEFSDGLIDLPRFSKNYIEAAVPWQALRDQFPIKNIEIHPA